MLRNAVPLVGLLFFHWSAANLLILYFVDTLLAIAVIVAGFLYSVSPAEEAPGLAARINTIAGYAAGAAFITLIMAIPLGMPVFILVFGVNDTSFTGMLADRGFQLGLGLQAIASLVSFRDLVTALRTYTPEQLGLKRRFALVFRALGRDDRRGLPAVHVPLRTIRAVRADRRLHRADDRRGDHARSLHRRVRRFRTPSRRR